MEKKLKILCTICTRKGSTGILNKNIKKINGNPLIYYTIKQAIKSNLFDAIVVSTDSQKIKKLSIKYGAESWFLRPKKYAMDSSLKLPAIRHAFKLSEKFYKTKFDILIDLDVTSPLRNVSDILYAYKKFKSANCSNLITVCRAKKNPYFNMVEIRKKKIYMVKKIKHMPQRRQVAPKVYELNASIYIWKRESILNVKNIITNKTSMYIMSQARSIDIDSHTDWRIVESLLKKQK